MRHLVSLEHGKDLFGNCFDFIRKTGPGNGLGILDRPWTC